MITDEQLKRLPQLFKDIVCKQRQISAYCSNEIVDFAAYKAQRKERRELYLAARQLYHPSASKGPSKRV